MLKMFKNCKGFTLLELLVVVLIIGILASIALPQYRNTVRRARVAEAKIALRAIVDATDRYILQHGDSYWSSLDELDVQIQEETNNWEIYIDECVQGENGLRGCIAIAEPKWENDYEIEYRSYNYDGGEHVMSGKFNCWAANDNGHKICKSLGGQLVEGYEDMYQL